MDASQAQTDVDSFAVLEPLADGFLQLRGRVRGLRGDHARSTPRSCSP